MSGESTSSYLLSPAECHNAEDYVQRAMVTFFDVQRYSRQRFLGIFKSQFDLNGGCCNSAAERKLYVRKFAA